MSGDYLPKKIVEAPAKVNLTLDVFPIRPDGFHELRSLVVLLRPADEIQCNFHAANRPSVALTCDDPSLPTDERNLAYRAAALFARRREIGDVAIRLELQKRLPHQAGLGGGSSDAAAVLRALAENFPIPQDLLIEIAAEIGSDVPLFLKQGTILMSGRGEIVTSAPEPLPRIFGVLVKPPVGVPTGRAYQRLDEIPARKRGSATESLLAVLQSNPNDLHAVADALGNDFEPAVLPSFPEVAEAHRAVADAGVLRALLCGSGSAIFGLAEDRAHAEAMAQTLRDRNRYPWVEVAESIP